MVETAERVDEGGSLDHVSDDEHASREQAQTRSAQATDEVFCQDRQTLLQCVVPCQAGVKLSKWLGTPVVISQDMGTDLVRNQGVGAHRRNANAIANEERAARDHEGASNVVSDLHGCSDFRPLRPVEADLAFGPLRERASVDEAVPRVLSRAWGTVLHDLFRNANELLIDVTKDLQASLEESPGVEIEQHRDLAIELILFLAEEHEKSRIFDSLDRWLIQESLEHDRIDRNGPIPERWRALEPIPLKLPPGLFGIDGRHLQQEVESIGDIGELTIDFPHCLDDGTPSKDVKVSWSIRRMRLDELVERPAKGS